MQQQIIIAICSAAVGGTITVFREDIRNIFNFGASGANEYLLGAWDCSSTTLAPARPQIQDTVKITRVRGNSVKGVGTTPTFGNWDLDGRVAHLAVSFSHSGRGSQKHVPGAIVLKKDGNDRMSGAWAQYSGTGEEVISGTTEWHRAPRH